MNKGKEIVHDTGTTGVVEVIVGGFIGGGLNNNACNKHLRAVITVENKKVKAKNVEKGSVILFKV